MSCIYEHQANNGSIIPVQVPCNNNVGSINLISGIVEYSEYGYNQDVAAVYAFVVLNALGTFVLVLQGVYWKQWWTLYTLASGALLEVLGWAGRLWSWKSQVWDINNGGQWSSNRNAFIMQICCLVIAPTFFSAANYIMLGRLIRFTGGVFSSISYLSFSSVFVIADIVCLVVQGAGGGIAGTANTTSAANNGADIMTAGVVIQLVVTIIFVGFLGEFIWRYKNSNASTRQYNLLGWCCGRRNRRQAATPLVPLNGSPSVTEEGKEMNAIPQFQTDPQLPPNHVWRMVYMIIWTTLLIVLRSGYRVAELSNGWRGSIETNQGLFIGMDATLMVILVFSWIAVHPGTVLGKKLL